MPVTGLRGRQILDGDIVRADLNVTSSGSAVTRRIVAGTNISLSSTGVDTGTGDVTINITGQVGVANGGTGAATLTGVVIGNGTGAMTAVAGTASQLLRRNAGNTAYEFFTGGNLTKTDDTNVTLTLGGTPTGSLINAVSLTLGWTGTLSVSRGGTGAATLTGVLIGNGTGAVTAVTGTASQLLRRNAGDTAYEFFTHSFASTGTGTTNTIAKYTAANTIGNSTITDNGNTITFLGTTSFIQAASLGASIGGTIVFVDDYASPVTGRMIFGDNTGWQFSFSTRSASVTTDRFTFFDSGQLRLNAYTTTTSFTGTIVGYLAYDSSGNVICSTGSGGGGVSGSGTSGTIPIWNGTTSLSNSIITYDSPTARLTINSASETSVRITGDGQGYTQGNIIFQTGINALNSPQARGLGTYYFNEGNDVIWYAGNPYSSGTDSFSILRLSSASFNGAAADPAVATTLFSIDVNKTWFTNQIQSTKANDANTGGGQILLNGATGNRIDFGIAGVDIPKFTTRSAGTKITFYPELSATTVDYAMGIESATLWFSIPKADGTRYFKWYGGTTNLMTLTGTNLYIYTPNVEQANSQAGAGATAFYVRNTDTTAAINRSTKIMTQHLGGGFARSVIQVAAYTATATNRGDLSILTEDGSQFIANIGTQISGGDFAFSLYSTASSENVRLNANGNSWIQGGNLALGNTSPTRQFSIYNASYAYQSFNSAGASAINFTIGSDASGFIIYDDTNGAYRLAVKSTGQLQLYNYTSTTSFTGTAAGYLAFTSTGLIITTAAPSGSSQWTTNVNDIYYNTGNVGIGVTAPLSPLHIHRASGTPTTIRWEQTGQRTYAMGLLGSNTALAIQDVTGSQTRWQLLSTGQFIFSAYTAYNSFSNTDAQGILGFDTSGNIISMYAPIYRHSFVTDPVTANNVPANVSFFASSNSYVTEMDLTGKKRGRLIARVTTAATAGTILRVRYAATFSATASSYLLMGATEIEVAISSTGILNSGWINLVAGAKIGTCYIALQTIGGDGATDPVLGQIVFETEE
jgi:hypothetical protein